jgi:hypothetical protein
MRIVAHLRHAGLAALVACLPGAAMATIACTLDRRCTGGGTCGDTAIGLTVVLSGATAELRIGGDAPRLAKAHKQGAGWFLLLTGPDDLRESFRIGDDGAAQLATVEDEEIVGYFGFCEGST